ncbi:MAG: hypothetical protein GPI96_19115 [Microcystis aeruginosa BS13-02]|jgi:hypothetical protein|nr:hypothetical protein [Microcystis aeruginosa BS13-02]
MSLLSGVLLGVWRTMRLENVTDTTILSIDQIKQDRELARQIQEILVYRFFLLEPPVDEN